MYEEDGDFKVRKSHDNVAVQKLYTEFLGAPNGHKAHELLHTKYTARGRY
ncbi:MAG: iron hydrogenase small subunit [Treponema sp.]|nr:iron hydrogenase small subunit [Treponema sp.]